MKFAILTTSFLSLLVLFMLGCGKEPSDAEMLARDQAKLKDNIYTQKVLLYKTVVIAVRSSKADDSVLPELKSFREKLDNINRILSSDSTVEYLSAWDYITLASDIYTLNKFARKTDEDIFPTILESFDYDIKDSTHQAILQGPPKLIVQNSEHTLLSMFSLLGSNYSDDIALYECYKTNPDLLPPCEVKVLIRFMRGFVFMQNKLYYLSEAEFTDNINWFERDEKMNIALSKMIFSTDSSNVPKILKMFKGFNYLSRGVDRMMMDRDIDEERAWQDLQKFVDTFEEIGIENELTWSIQALVSIHNEDTEKAIATLQKLRTSPLLSSDDIEIIDDSISYLKEGRTGRLKKLYDKFFIAKIMTKFIISKLGEVNWQKLLKDNGVPYTDEMFETLHTSKKFLANIEKYGRKDTYLDPLKDIGNDVEKEGHGIIDDAKGWWESLW